MDQNCRSVGIVPIRCFNPSVGILLVWTSDLYHLRGFAVLFQSLGRDSVGLDKKALWRIINRVSIPRSGFCWFGPGKFLLLGVALQRFQSLGRDSVGLDLIWRACSPPALRVSIPRSGFCWFGLDAELVSIPRSGFCWFGPLSKSSGKWMVYKFQSLGRDSVGLDLRRDHVGTGSG